jgi:hypothetical protein
VLKKTKSYTAILMISGMACNATAGTFMYEDIRKPGGHKRDLSALAIDAKFCDQKIGVQTGGVSTEYNKCMRSRGWSFSHAEEKTNPKEDSDASSTQKEVTGGRVCRQEWNILTGTREVCDP